MPGPDPWRGQTRAITSLQNERVKLIRSLEMRKTRRETGLFVAEGASVLVTAREAGWTPKMLVFLAGSAQSGVARALLDWAEGAGAECLEVSQAVLAKVAAKDNPQTLLAVFEQRWAAEPDPARVADDAVWVALEAVRDPGNLGTIIRTADAAGAEGVILVGSSVDPFSIEAVRATMGSIFNVALCRLRPAEFATIAGGWPGMVVGTHLAATVDYRDALYRTPVLLIMGGERAGLSADIARLCKPLVRIPMAGRADSLNLAVATGVMLFEIRRGALTLGG
jgi:TrmH family RNA methyltransferase